MAEKVSMGQSPFLVVWAKIRGYPWWPGVVSGNQIEISNSAAARTLNPDCIYTVRFIGENTQYSLISSNLSAKFINDFDQYFFKHSSTKNKVFSKQTLLNCISLASKLATGEIGLEDLGTHPKGVKAAKAVDSEILQHTLSAKLGLLQEVVSKRAQNSESEQFDSLDVVQSHIEYLSSVANAIRVQDEAPSQLCDTLIELARMKISIPVLQHSRIQNLLSIIAHVCKQSRSKTIQQLGNVVESLRQYWKSVLKQNTAQERGVADWMMRNKVCQKIANVFELNGFERNEARELAVSIEEKIRNMDPSMGGKYRSCFRRMIKEIKHITPSLYMQSRKEKY
jgi:hypothetical protein